MYFSKFAHTKGTKERLRKWKNALTDKPEPYSLNFLKLEDGSVIRGWWCGSHWDGLKVKITTLVTKFKKCGE